jgi:hypothetical protein
VARVGGGEATGYRQGPLIVGLGGPRQDSTR